MPAALWHELHKYQSKPHNFDPFPRRREMEPWAVVPLSTRTLGMISSCREVKGTMLLVLQFGVGALVC